MAHHHPAPPAFGQADLSNCEREQIHLAGSIQPHGVLLGVSEPDLRVVQASTNLASYTGLDGEILGCSLHELPGDLSESLEPHLDQDLHEIPTGVRCRFGEPLADYDCMLHRPGGPTAKGVVLELERAGPPIDLSTQVEDALEIIRRCASLQQLADETARIFKQVAGYDRAMVYRFDDEGHGEILSERRNPDLESYLGQRYPASDIPQIARRLYERNRVRVLVDATHERVPVEPRISPLTGDDLDMSLCSLRAMSPIHTQYLQNMGVAATLVASLVVGGRLWGLVACHHYSPRAVQYETRCVCELLAEAVATRISALESFAQAQAELSVRRLEQRMAEVIAQDGDWQSALFDGTRSLLQPLAAHGAALLFEGEIRTIGEVPGTQELRALGGWLDGRERVPAFATSSLGHEEPAFEHLSATASGMVAAPISSTPGEYLLWFRPAQIRTVVWGGNPFKPFVVGDDPADLSPRRSFAKWHQQVEGTSEPWGPAELAAAKLIGETVAGIVLQFRSVQVLIARDQLETVQEQVRCSDHPVVIADPKGQILLGNDAFEALLAEDHPRLRRIPDLALLFDRSQEVGALLNDLIERRRSIRGEFDLARGSGGTVLLRGDPVLAAPGRLLGHVVLVSDQSERKAVEAARQRLQNALIAEHPLATFGDRRDLTYRHLLSSLQGNAQLAALEITDGIDPSRMPEMLESVRDSLDRTAGLLEHLADHAARASKKRS